MIKLIEILLILILTSGNVKSQVTQEWSSRYGGSGIEGANSIATDLDGNVYVTGSDQLGSEKSLAIIKYSSSGQQLWIAKYIGNASGYNAGYSIKIDKMGNVIVTGTFFQLGTKQDIITLKYSAFGLRLWVNTYSSSGSHDDFSGNVVIDSSDNIYITGTSNNYYVTIKYDSSGVQKWIDLYDLVNHTGVSRAMTIDKCGNVYITGESGDSFTLIDIATIKYNSFGIRQWVARYNSPTSENDYGLAIGVDSDGNVYVCGGSQGDLHYDDYVTVKYDSSGIEQWNRRYNGSANFVDQARALVIDNSNNVYISGYATQAGTGYDFTTIKYNTFGDQIWLRKYNNGLNDIANDMTIDNYDNLYVTGQSDGNSSNYDYATIKYNASGNQIWAVRYDYSGQYGDYPQALVLDINGSVIVTGSSNRDYLTIKYSQLTGAIINETNVPAQFTLMQNYPNPFNPFTRLEFGISKFGFVALKVYDLLGNEVKTLVKEDKPAGNYETEFDGTDMPSGIYFYSLLIDGNVIDTKRMILLK